MGKTRFSWLLCSTALLLAAQFPCSREAWAQQAPSPAATSRPGTPEGTEIDEEELAKDATTEINVRNADLAAIIRIFSKRTKRNYILDDRVKGKVSIYLPGKVTTDDAVRILDAVLAYKGFTTVPIGENLWKIVPSKEAKQSTIPTVTDPLTHTPTQTMITRLVQLKFVGSEDMRGLVSQLVSPDGLVTAHPSTNSLLIIDNEDNAKRVVDIINTLDVPFSDRQMTIIPIKNADAKEIADKLAQILGIGSSGGKGRGGDDDSGIDLVQARIREANQAALGRQPGQPPGAAPGVQPAAMAPGASSASTRAREPKIIADERTNSIIVVADEDTTARVRALISQLDSKLDLSGTRFYVYRCQHAKADELAEVLSSLGSGLSSSTGRRSTTSTGGLAGEPTDLISGGRGGSSLSRGSQMSRSSQDRLRSQQRTPGRSRLDTQGRRTGVPAANLGEDFSVTADPATNSLIIFASKSDYERMLELLRELDIKRRQVLVEAILLEVGLDDSQTLGMSWIASTGGADGGVLAQNNGGNIINLLKDPSQIQDFSIAAASAGTLSIGDKVKIPTQTVLLNAAKSNSNVNVLSAPTILTTDNEQAEIVVGQNVPFVASQATSDVNLNNTFNQIDRQDVGITLRLTPQISSTDSVTLRIFTEVSSVASTDPNLGPTTSIRTSETSVITRDGQMVVIGGLMADDINDAESGVPFLKDIPVLGHLFTTSIGRRRRTNLLILITPRVVKDQFDARDVTLAKRDTMEKEIQQQEIYPARREVLHNADMDHVSDLVPYDGPAPTTIRPSGKPNPKEAASKNVLELRLPAAGPKHELTTESRAGQRFIIAQLEGDESLPAKLPFKVSGQDKLVGIEIPEDGAAALNFFTVGRHYAYTVNGRGVKLTPLGIFASPNEAKAMSGGKDLYWYTLSPYEIMRLGKGPWIRLER